jgi:ketosteroid isomerase-like protein
MSEQTRLRPEPGWARTNQHSRVGRLDHGSVEQALDRLLIAERVYRYGWAYDEKDRELLADCFTEDGVWEGSIMGQTSVGPFEGREAIVEWLAAFWDEQDDQRRHIFTNVIVQDLAADTAVAHAYLLLTGASDASMSPITTGPYRLELAREEDSWRLRRLVGGFDAPF